MRQIQSEQSRGIFRQLANLSEPTGVKTVIENHDAWLHNADVEEEIALALLALEHRSRPAETTKKMQAQRQALAGLVTRVPCRIASAG